eukprot:13875319-Alexandrium_andersonii.AAC.1
MSGPCQPKLLQAGLNSQQNVRIELSCYWPKKGWCDDVAIEVERSIEQLQDPQHGGKDWHAKLGRPDDLELAQRVLHLVPPLERGAREVVNKGDGDGRVQVRTEDVHA